MRGRVEQQLVEGEVEPAAEFEADLRQRADMAKAEPFVQRGQMRAVAPRMLTYACDFVSVLRRSPQPPRAALAFHQALLAAHGA